MQDDIDSTGNDTPPTDEPDVIGKVARWARFGVGARATIMIGVTIGVVTIAGALPAAASSSTSIT